MHVCSIKKLWPLPFLGLPISLLIPRLLYIEIHNQKAVFSCEPFLARFGSCKALRVVLLARSREICRELLKNDPNYTGPRNPNSPWRDRPVEESLKVTIFPCALNKSLMVNPDCVWRAMTE